MPEAAPSSALPDELPLLIGLGPIRSGTSWVHELLFGHSQVATTVMKEVNFFNLNFTKGPDWYAGQFKPRTPATRLMADISPFYMMDPTVCDRIARTVSNPILMINLRSPYERILSWYQKYRQEDHTIDKLASDTRMHGEALEIGLTATMLEHYFARFGRERVILVDYDDLKRDPLGLAGQLQQRLGLDFETPRSVTREVNASVRYRSAILRRLAHLIGPRVRKLSPQLFYAMKYGLLHDVIFAKKRLSGPSASEKVAVLASMRTAFEADIDRLEQLLGRDLADWRYEPQVAALAPAQAPAERRLWPAFAGRVAVEARTLWSVFKDPAVPLRARAASIAVVSYLAMPFDIIPNRIPIVGHLDEAATIPLALALLLWLSPTKLVRRHRTRARRGDLPPSGGGGELIA